MVGPVKKGKATCRHDLKVKSSSQSSLLAKGKAGSQTTVKLSEISNSPVMSSALGAFDVTIHCSFMNIFFRTLPDEAIVRNKPVVQLRS